MPYLPGLHKVLFVYPASNSEWGTSLPTGYSVKHQQKLELISTSTFSNDAILNLNLELISSLAPAHSLSSSNGCRPAVCAPGSWPPSACELRPSVPLALGRLAPVSCGLRLRLRPRSVSSVVNSPPSWGEEQTLLPIGIWKQLNRPLIY
jgi:hypothetical protein